MRSLLTAFADGIRCTAPYLDQPQTTRPADTIWEAHNRANLALRQPLYHRRLGKNRPKPKAYDAAIQQGLAVLAAFASAAGTRQIIVRLSGNEREAISMQPRPFGVNWVRRHGITPASLHDNHLDPLPTPHPGFGSAGMAAELSTRGVLHLAGKTALALQLSLPDEDPDGTATFVFDNRFMLPQAYVVFRPLTPNRPARTVALARP